MNAVADQTVRVMVVDDHPMWREGVERDLESAGFEVVAVAANGEEALARALGERPDLILMDLKMPGMDGVAAAQSIRGDLALREVPIVAVTADNTAYYREKTREAGFSDYLVKPFEAGELEGVLERLLPKTNPALH